MFVETGKFGHPERHHSGKVRVFVFRWCVEIWIGRRYFIIGR